MTILLLLFVGLLLSAYFSGTETGLYRVSRVRLLLDALGGDWIARGLLWLTNNPTLFIATTLIGNNTANCLVSLGIVLATERIFGFESAMSQLIGPVICAPIIFIYGELLPKSLYYLAPNRLLRVGTPLLFGFGLFFAPLIFMLWIFGRILRKLLGESPEQVRLMLARKELASVLEEGHHAGILKPAQRDLAQGLFSVAHRSVIESAIPATQVVTVRRGASKSEVFRLARRLQMSAIPVKSESHPGGIVGYVRMVDLKLDGNPRVEEVRPMLKIRSSQTHIDALIQMQNSRESLAQVVDDDGNMVGLLNNHRLIEALFRGV
jgi:CBS domain containing-hemolysin-like protein